MTPTRCRAGQCARIIASVDPSRRMVYVVQRIYPDAGGRMIVNGVRYRAIDVNAAWWLIEAIGGPFPHPTVGPCYLTPIRDTSLEPLPDPDPETETTDKELTV